MDDNVKAKHELMTRILSWGMIVYFLVLGYSLNQSSSFELCPNPAQEKLVKAKEHQANVLREQSNQNTDQSNANTKAAENVKAAELDLEAIKIKDGVYDGQRRAGGLIIAATVFFIFYVFLIYKFYQKFELEMSDYVVSKKTALIYALFIGGSIWVTAVMTAIF